VFFAPEGHRRGFSAFLNPNSSWDERLLGDQLKVLSEELGFDLEVIGFETAEIDVLIGGLQTNSESDPHDRLPAIETWIPALSLR